MKFREIGIAKNGGKIAEYIAEIDTTVKTVCSTYCTAEIRKGDDTTNSDAIDLVLRWNYFISRNRSNKYSFYRSQHYRLSELETAAKNEDIAGLIKESFDNLMDEFFDRLKLSKDLLVPVPLSFERTQNIIGLIKQSLLRTT